MRRKRSPLEVGEHWCVQWARCILFLHSQLRPQHPARAVHLTSAELGDCEGSAALRVSSSKGLGEGRTQTSMTGPFHPFCSDRMHSATAWYYLTLQKKKKKWHREDGGRERSVAMLTFQLPVGSGRSGQEDTLPGTKTEKRGTVNAHSPVQGRRLPPRGHLT